MALRPTRGPRRGHGCKVSTAATAACRHLHTQIHTHRHTHTVGLCRGESRGQDTGVVGGAVNPSDCGS